MGARAQTVTILFTDLVSSTELLQRAGDERAQRIFKAHHRLLSEAVQAHGGHEVKWLGDGLMVAFDSALDAVRCAIAMQQGSRRPAAGERLEIRVGLNVGEALVDESDYFGTPVVVARRLCDRADAGQILASDVVVRLLEGRGASVQSKDLGALELKGIANPVPAIEIVYQHDPMALLRHLPFVGRQQEFDALTKRLAEACNGQGSIVLLAGEPGVGKTRLAEEFCAHASSDVTVIRGNGYEGEVSAPYSPWLEALRSLIDQTPDGALQEELALVAPDIASILPEVLRRFPTAGDASRLEPEAQRVRLFESIATLLRHAGRQRPVVILLDDLQWADRPSLLLVEMIARGIGNERVMIVGTYRDVAVDRLHPLVQTLGALRRMEHHERLIIRGFTKDAVSDLLAAIEPSEETALGRAALAVALHAESEGNPFFIREVLNHLVETGKLVQQEGRWLGTVASIEELGIPQGVKEVVGHRLSRLSEGCNRVLQRASLMTGGFTWDELKAICDERESDLLDALDQALGAQLIEDREHERYDFTHGLIRHTLYEELSRPRRVLLHRQVAEALERLYADDLDAHLGELAAHYMASTGGEAQKALEYSARAADRAMAQYAWEEAVAHYERGLQALQLARPGDGGARCDLLLRLGEAQRTAGRQERALETFREAAALGRELGNPTLTAQAAIGFSEVAWRIYGDPQTAIDALALLDHSLIALGPQDSALRVMAIGHRTRFAVARNNTLLSAGSWGTGGYTLYSGRREPELTAQAREAVAMAVRLGDDLLTASAMSYLRGCIWQPDNVEARLEISAEIVRLASLSGAAKQEFEGRVWHAIDLLELGEMSEFDTEVGELERLAQQTREPIFGWYPLSCKATRAIARGDREAETLVFQALAFGQSVNAPEAVIAFGAQLSTLRRNQGRWGEVEGIMREAVKQSPNVPGYKAVVVEICAETGNVDTARREFEEIAGVNFEAIPDDYAWMISMRLLSGACAYIGDVARAEQLYRLFSPYEHRNVVVAWTLSEGSVSRSLGQLATLLCRWDDAVRHFEHALEMNRRMEHWPWVVRSQLNYAQMLLARGAAGDGERARELLEAALATAREIGMAKVASDCEGLLAG